MLAKQFEQRIAGMRLEKEQGKVDKSLLRRLEKELSELKSLSATMLAVSGRRSSPPGGRYATEAGSWEPDSPLQRPGP